jgi:hypothetical protein
MRTVFSILFVFFISILSVSGQEHYNYTPGSDNDYDTVYVSQFDTIDIQNVLNKGDWGHLSINADERIADLLDIQKEISIRKRGIDGYRVQLFQGSKDEAFRIKAEFMKKYPDCKVYILFRTPDFRVRAGDFRTRSEAIKLKYTVEKNFPNPLIVEDIINFPDLVFEEGNK